MPPTDHVSKILVSLIDEQCEKEKRQDIWGDSNYKNVVKLQSNNAGIVGESLINDICKASGIDASCNGAKTKAIGGGSGDGHILGIPIEIKTSHQGSYLPTFQHELGENPWKYGKYMIFVDIAPKCIYLTIFENFDEMTYKSNRKLVGIFPTKQITWRKKHGAFKLDTSVKINESSVSNGNAIKIVSNTSVTEVASFIRSKIV